MDEATSFSFVCNHCDQLISADITQSGGMGTCPKCKCEFKIPIPTGRTLKFKCHICDQHITAPLEQAGCNGVCPRCKNQFKIPIPSYLSILREGRTVYDGEAHARFADEQLADIAKNQKALIWLIPIAFIAWIGYLILPSLGWLGLLLVWIFSMVYAFQLAGALKSSSAWTFAVLFTVLSVVFPFLGFIALLVLLGKASKVQKTRGIKAPKNTEGALRKSDIHKNKRNIEMNPSVGNNNKLVMIVVTGITIMVFLLIFPPWNFVCQVPPRLEKYGPYYFILTPPEVPVSSAINGRGAYLGYAVEYWTPRIDLPRLSISIVVVALCTVGMAVFCSRKK